MSSIRDFIPLEKLGQGTYSNVYKVKRVTDQEIYALKKVKMDSLTLKQKQNALNEVRILASIQAQHIVAYKQAFFDQNLNVLCVVMEYANEGDLQKVIKQYTKSYKLIPQDQIWKAAQNILKGLQNLHERGILHRDIKCANIFKCKGFYKLGDLNVSKVNGDKLAYTQTGTPYYASPEVWRDEPYDSKSDIWSFGCIIYQMAALKPPFQGKDMQDLFKSVQKAILKPLSAQYSNQLWEFLSLCLQKDPKKRPSTKQLLQKLDILVRSYQNTHAHMSQNYSRINNPQTKKSNQTDALLRTIKVPTDLKKLKDSLPQSKYKKNIPQKQKINNSNIVNVQNSISKGGQSQVKLSVKVEQSNNMQSASNSKHQDKGKTKINIETNNSSVVVGKINKSQIFQSPRNFLNQNSYKSPKSRLQVQKSNVQGILLKSPRSQVRLGKKVQSQPKHSQRLYASDKKQSYSNKVEKAFSIQNYIKLTQDNESLLYLKKPSSMPRTQKMQALINNSSRAGEISVNANLNNLSHINKQMGNKYFVQDNRKNDALDQWRKKLVKKTRILSSNHPKPTWWG